MASAMIQLYTLASIHSFIPKYFLSVYYVSGTLLRIQWWIKTHLNSALIQLRVQCSRQWEERGSCYPLQTWHELSQFISPSHWACFPHLPAWPRQHFNHQARVSERSVCWSTVIEGESRARCSWRSDQGTDAEIIIIAKQIHSTNIQGAQQYHQLWVELYAQILIQGLLAFHPTVLLLDLCSRKDQWRGSVTGLGSNLDSISYMVLEKLLLNPLAEEPRFCLFVISPCLCSPHVN